MTELLLRTFVPGYPDVQDPAVRERCGTLSGVVGICLNLLLCAGKFFAGILTGAVSVTADALNNLSDAASSVVTLVGFRLAGRRADEDHPYGHGRMEYLAGLAVAVVVMLVGFELAKSAVEKILHPQEVAFSMLSVGILLASILVKLWIYRFNHVLGKKINSPAMGATAADALSDCVATGAVLAGLVINQMTGKSVDGWVGVLVSFFVLRAGWEAVQDTIDPLLGKAPDPELVQAIAQTVLAHPEVHGIHDLMVHDYGPGHVMVTLHAEVDRDGDIAAIHDAIDDIERELGEKFHLLATIHMDPMVTNDERVNALRERMAALAREIDPALTIHDFRMTEGPTHKNLIFDILLPKGSALSEETVRARMTELVLAAEPDSKLVLQVDRNYI